MEAAAKVGGAVGVDGPDCSVEPSASVRRHSGEDGVGADPVGIAHQGQPVPLREGGDQPPDGLAGVGDLLPFHGAGAVQDDHHVHRAQRLIGVGRDVRGAQGQFEGHGSVAVEHHLVLAQLTRQRHHPVFHGDGRRCHRRLGVAIREGHGRAGNGDQASDDDQ